MKMHIHNCQKIIVTENLAGVTAWLELILETPEGESNITLTLFHEADQPLPITTVPLGD